MSTLSEAGATPAVVPEVPFHKDVRASSDGCFCWRRVASALANVARGKHSPSEPGRRLPLGEHLLCCQPAIHSGNTCNSVGIGVWLKHEIKNSARALLGVTSTLTESPALGSRGRLGPVWTLCAESQSLVSSCTMIHELPRPAEGKTSPDFPPRRAAAGQRVKPSRQGLRKRQLPLRGNTFSPEEIEKLSHRDTRLLL
ncbi:hypothetical protein HPG69_000321 [Diceros bicornis minor]|uniref:Uncharacterized protein n=1 Tax=Diceros bicornis minor TaxID=77932 RepID=A0A7J7EV83_DICBM|nr:hypothetical protein HPG69_000321 [Diceros bicornis minor]